MKHPAHDLDHRVAIATILAILIAMWLHGHPALADTPGDHRAQLEGAVAAMNQVDRDDLFRTDSWRPDRDDILAAIAAARRCEASATAMTRAGSPADTRVAVPESLTDIPGHRLERITEADRVGGVSARGWRGSAPLGQLTPYCASFRRLAHRALIQPVMARHAGRLAHHTAHVERAIAAGKIDRSHAVLVELDRDRCIADVDRALADRVPPDTTIDLDRAVTGLPETMTFPLADARRAVCDSFDRLFDRARHGERVAIEARLAPYARAFGGKKSGRFKAFVEHKLGHVQVYGPGHKRLSTPRDFARARRWYVLGHTTGTLTHPRWRMQMFRFRGARFTVREISGRGAEPPPRAFR